MPQRALTVGSLFTGIGGLDLGLERAGLRVAWQCEIDAYASVVLERHWPHIPRLRDVRQAGPHSLAPVDVLAGGFPCQDVSAAGRRAGIAGPRSGLWSEFARLIRQLRPRYALVENVPGLLGRGMGAVLGDLAAGGYDAEWQCLTACAFGAPHIRERVVIVAYPHRLGRQAVFPQAPGPAAPAGAESPAGAQGGQPGALLPRSDWGLPPGGLRGVADGAPDRLDRYRVIGNAVVPAVAEYVGRLIVAHAAREDAP